MFTSAIPFCRYRASYNPEALPARSCQIDAGFLAAERTAGAMSSSSETTKTGGGETRDASARISTQIIVSASFCSLYVNTCAVPTGQPGAGHHPRDQWATTDPVQPCGLAHWADGEYLNIDRTPRLKRRVNKKISLRESMSDDAISQVIRRVNWLPEDVSNGKIRLICCVRSVPACVRPVCSYQPP